MADPRNIENYTHLLAASMPTGPAWPREQGTAFMGLLEGLAVGFADIEESIGALPIEADPRRTFEMLPEWETALALPDDCAGDATTLQERRMAATARYLNKGGQSNPYFYALAAAYGYQVTINEFRPFQCGKRCGDKLGGPPTVRYFWRVKVTGPRVTYFRTGESQCGDTLAKISRADDLECIFNRLHPAETELIFSYEGGI